MKLVEKSRKEKIRDQMMFEKENHLLQEQMTALKSALKISQAENESIRKELEKEVMTVNNVFCCNCKLFRNSFGISFEGLV